MGKAVRMSQRPSKSPYKCSQRVLQRDVPTPLGNRSSNVVGQHTSTQVLATCMMTPELRNEVVQIVNALIHSPATVSVTSPDSVNERQQSNTVGCKSFNIGPGSKDYNQQFRLKKARNPAMSWATVDQELWLLYIHTVQPNAPSYGVDMVNTNRKCFTSSIT
ncbi:Hypothetical predicted protein [Mytilus galloprovincialis]|uniref:Uncharacterized protein n=1 Tax=Mytilus galloprovincialis TaxID=29158 RepID=A0A8B6EUZ0_MYTGA|nr:Hypothetical predicted protein [Mytilus galloprovincialis]